MEDRIFGDADTVADLVRIAKIGDHVKSAALTSLVRRGFPAQLFGGDIRDDSPVFEGHIGFSCKAVEAAMRRLGFMDEDITTLIQKGHIVGVIENTAGFGISRNYAGEMTRLKPKLSELAGTLTFLLEAAAKETKAAIASGKPISEPKTKAISSALQLHGGKFVSLAD